MIKKKKKNKYDDDDDDEETVDREKIIVFSDEIPEYGSGGGGACVSRDFDSISLWQFAENEFSCETYKSRTRTSRTNRNTTYRRGREPLFHPLLPPPRSHIYPVSLIEYFCSHRREMTCSNDLKTACVWRMRTNAALLPERAKRRGQEI